MKLSYLKIDTTNLHEAQIEFFEKSSLLFDYRRSEYYDYDAKNKEQRQEWAREFSVINSYFSLLPEEYREENFYKFINLFIDKRYDLDNKFNLLPLNLFKDFIHQDIFKNYLPRITQHINNERHIFTIIENQIEIDNLELANEFTQWFILPENRQLKSIKNAFTKTLEENKKIIINFLLENYDGWDTKETLKSVFKLGPLDDSFLNSLLVKIGPISDNDLKNEIASNIVERKFSENRKLDILEKIVPYFTYNFKVHNFYLNNLQEGEFTMSKLIARNSPFIKNLINQDYINAWFNESPSYFTIDKNSKSYAFIEKYISKEHIYRAIEQYAEVGQSSWSVFDDINNYLISNKVDINTPLFQKNLIKIYEYHSELGQKHYGIHQDNINENIELNYSNNSFWNSLSSYLKIKKDELYLLKFFSENKNQTIEQLFEQLQEKKGSVGYQNQDLIKNSPYLKKVYQQLRKNLSAQEFFDTYIIQHSYSTDSARTVRDGLFEQFKKDNNSLVFDLETNHPLGQFIKNNFNPDPKSSNASASIELLFKLVEYLGYTIAQVPYDKNESVVSFARRNDLWMGNNYQAIEANTPVTNSVWKSLFSKKPQPLQLVVENNVPRIIYNPSEKIISAANQAVPIASSNSLDELMEQAQTNLHKLHQVLDANSEKPLILDVKIRSEKILLDNISFLNDIKGSIDEVDIENMNFLRNNLGKYLLESIGSYVKAVGRYESISNSTKKMTSSSLDELEQMKEKIDKEELRQINLLEQELEVVKKNILSQFNQDIVKEMKVRTRILEAHLENSENRSMPAPMQGKVVNILGKP